MEIKEKINEGKRLQKEMPILAEINKSYAWLESHYFWSLFISGLMFLWASHHIGWVIGIGWFFMSNFLAKVLVRLDMVNNISNIIKLWQLENTKDIKPWLN